MRSSDSLDVYMLTQDYAPRLAGAERQIQALVPALRRRDVPVTVLTRRFKGSARRDTVAGGPVYRLPVPGGRILGSVCFTLGGLLFLARARRRVALLHAHDLFSPTTLAVLAKLILRRPVVAKPLCGGPLGDVAALRRLRSGPLRRWLLARSVDRFIAISREIARELSSIGVPPERIVRIPNGVDTEQFRPSSPERRAVLRGELDLEGQRVALFLGRLEPQKDPETLLDAWTEVRRALPDALLLLVGDGRLRPALERRRLSGVRFVGPVGDPLPYLQAADCFVLPSRYEGLPNALLEAMASGLAVVTTAVGGNADVVRAGVDGWLVPPGDAAALASALVRALAGDERGPMGAAARERVVESFSLEATADRLCELYRQLVRRGASAR